MISPDLLQILVCPACRSSLSLSADQQSLRCGGCRRVYPIRNGLPILLVEEAKIEDQGGSSASPLS
jgi:uncharacterized protein YbaR (Trm112 family)